MFRTQPTSLGTSCTRRWTVLPSPRCWWCWWCGRRWCGGTADVVVLLMMWRCWWCGAADDVEVLLMWRTLVLIFAFIFYTMAFSKNRSKLLGECWRQCWSSMLHWHCDKMLAGADEKTNRNSQNWKLKMWQQERMKRQMESLQERVSGAPSDIGDIRLGIAVARVIKRKSWNADLNPFAVQR